MTTIATQIHARLDAIAAERLRLSDEERRLKKALEALESAVETSETPRLDEAIQRCIVPMSPSMAEQMRRLAEKAPCASPASMPYSVPHYPFQPLRHPGYDISGVAIEGIHESQFSGWHSPPWHTVTGKACGDVVTAEELNAHDD